MIILTQNIWKRILRVNRNWNDRIQYQSDGEHYGKRDWWCFPYDNIGDCEDYAIAKRQALESFSIPGYFATCWTKPERQGYHAVLLLDTHRGTFVLSNGIDEVLGYQHMVTAYGWEWHKRECGDRLWRKIL